MNVLIIGCNGFIGSNLLKYFSQKGFATVAGCDVQETGESPSYFCFAKEENGFDSLFKKNSFDCCINCSGAANVPDSLKNPLQDFELNTFNVFKMLEAVRRYQPFCKFLNLSSAAVYGNPKKLPVSEKDELAPVSPYGLHKMQAEQLCKSFFDYWQIPTCSLRIFSAYGPGLKKQLFWDLYQKSLRSDNVELFGTGSETRDFIFIDDIVQAVELVINKSFFRGECINVANGQEISIKEAVRVFYHTIAWEGKISFVGDIRKGDPLNWQADVNALRSLGYRQGFDLNKGLKAYAKWVREKG
jgi:dTDP-glucose 4,6-dehydratase/UDP-glucose 4-epimerase